MSLAGGLQTKLPVTSRRFVEIKNHEQLLGKEAMLHFSSCEGNVPLLVDDVLPGRLLCHGRFNDCFQGSQLMMRWNWSLEILTNFGFNTYRSMKVSESEALEGALKPWRQTLWLCTEPFRKSSRIQEQHWPWETNSPNNLRNKSMSQGHWDQFQASTRTVRTGSWFRWYMSFGHGLGLGS
jgi:hypothetical protein